MQFFLPTPPHRDARALCELAREILAGLMQCDASTLPSDVALRDLGVDSRTTVALIAALATQLSRTLAPTLVYAYPTLDALAEHLAKDEATADLNGGDADSVRVEGDLPVDEPIAIIGIGCRFPGGGSDPEAYFELLRNGIDAVIEAPETRSELWTDEAQRRPLRGGFLDDVASFDEAFFGISPREASAMDPQQRLMLEVSWEALEDAGIAPNNLVDTRTGVFVGAMWQDYAHHSAALSTSIEQHTATGLDTSVIAARISYRFGLRGPSLTVNTACSSALVALHLACQSLRQRESTLALAGGVNLILSPHSSVAMERFGALSADARCKAFDAAADGYVRGEGAGVVVLKRLADAVAAGDPIYCVIRGSAVNNDGASNGLAAPSESAQVQVLHDAYARARIAPSKVHYVEAHGTGTRVGDPIEAQALGEVLGRGRSADRALRIGSVKTNLGHLEAAAGIASVIKVALAMRKGYLPPSLHLVAPNPAIDFERLGLCVQQAGSAWPRPDEVPVAGVSGFGFGGTNAHVVLEGAHQARHELLVVAADDPRVLQAQIERLGAAAQHVESSDGLRALCQSSAQHWSEGRVRKALVVRSAEEITEQLERAPAETAPSRPRRIAFVYSGVGSQWAGMARALLATEPVFRAAVERCDVAIEQITGRSILSDLWSGDPRMLARCERYQPMIFAIQVGLSALFEAFGVVPDAVVGQSIGEVAAAHRAGILSLPDACAVICHMARLLARAEGDGAMLLLGLSSNDAHALLAEVLHDGSDDPVVIAAENGPHSTVVSGARNAVGRVGARAQARGILTMPVQTEIAFHHPMLRHALAPLPGALATIAPEQAKIAMWSTTDSAWLDGRECHGRYFQRNQLQRVRFAQAIDVLAHDGPYSFVEIGPHPLLVRELREGVGLRDSSPVVVPSMTRSDQVRSGVLDSLATLFRAGHALEYRLAGQAAHAATPQLPLPLGARRFMPLVRSSNPDFDAKPFTLPLAAHSDSALRQSASTLSELIARTGEAALPDLMYKLARVRTALPHRATITATDAAELRQGLDALARGDHARGLVTAEHDSSRARRTSGRLAFVFSGHGSQWAGMGRELLRGEPVFAAAIDACDGAFAELGAPRVRPQLEHAQHAFPKRADQVQPLLFAMQIALARLWLSWGVTPDVIVGHSVGEIAAAHVAGLIDLKSATRIVIERAAVLVPAIGQGAMALVELPLSETQALVERYRDRISVAVHHSPTCCVLAGEREALAEALRVLDERHVFCRWVDVDYASHSPQMQPIAAELRQRLAGAIPTTSTPLYPMLSTTLGRVLRAGECDAAYWAANLAQPVLFREAIEQLVRENVTSYLELSPHPLLSNGILETARTASTTAQRVTFVPSLRRNSPERHMLHEALGQLFVSGHRVDWARQHPIGSSSVALPPYPFERRRHWKSERVTLSPVADDAAHAAAAAPAKDATPARHDAAAKRREQLRSTQGEARTTLLRAIIRGELALLLRTEESRIEQHAPLQELGVDSLMGLQLRSRLEDLTGVTLSGTRMWEKPTLEGLIDLLASDA